MKKLYQAAMASVFILLASACGGNAPQTQNTQPLAARTVTAAPPAESGEGLYVRNCSSCHLPSGQGMSGTYPPLAKSDFLANKEKTIKVLLKGLNGEVVVNGVKYNNVMAAQSLNDDEAAAVLTYINTSFGNTGGLVTAAEVKAVRVKG